MKLALDANVIIYAIDLSSPFHETAQEILDGVTVHGYEIQVSELLYLEVLAIPKLSDVEAKDFYEIVRRIASVNWPVDTEVLLMAAKLRRNRVVKTPDAIHLASAIINKADYFVTNDRYLLKLDLKAPKIISAQDVRALVGVA